MLQTMTLPFRLTSHAKTTHADKPNSVALALEHIIYTGDNKYLPPVPLDKAGSSNTALDQLSLPHYYGQMRLGTLHSSIVENL